MPKSDPDQRAFNISLSPIDRVQAYLDWYKNDKEYEVSL